MLLQSMLHFAELENANHAESYRRLLLMGAGGRERPDKAVSQPKSPAEYSRRRGSLQGYDASHGSKNFVAEISVKNPAGSLVRVV